jgi:prevent-host-death family protein
VARKIPLAEAKSRFSDCVRRAEAGEACLLTRHGKPVVALVPASDLDNLQRLRAAGPGAGLVSVAGGWKGSEDLARTVARSRRTRPRRLPRA